MKKNLFNTIFNADKSLVKPGIHIVAVGADMAGKNEWDPVIFKGAKIVNDSIAQCVSRGETRNAIISGVIKETDIYAEIGQLIAGEKPSRESDDEITIFDTTGMGIQDNDIWLILKQDVSMEKLFQVALKQGILLNPGDIYDFKKNNALRLSYSYIDKKDIMDNIKKLSDVVRNLIKRPH